MQNYVVCTRCHSVSRESASKTNGAVLFILLLFFIIPGIIYGLWGSNQRVCPRCGGDVVPGNTPLAREIVPYDSEQLGQPSPRKSSRLMLVLVCMAVGWGVLLSLGYWMPHVLGVLR